MVVPQTILRLVKIGLPLDRRPQRQEEVDLVVEPQPLVVVLEASAALAVIQTLIILLVGSLGRPTKQDLEVLPTLRVASLVAVTQVVDLAKTIKTPMGSAQARLWAKMLVNHKAPVVLLSPLSKRKKARAIRPIISRASVAWRHTKTSHLR